FFEARGYLDGERGFPRRLDAQRKPMIIFIDSAPVAQLDRASGYEPEGREFESPRARHYLCLRPRKQKSNHPRSLFCSMNHGEESPVCASVLRTKLLPWASEPIRSEEHTSELQSRVDLVCRLLLE